MSSRSDSRAPSPKRRLIVAGLGGGVLAALLVKLGWRARPDGVAAAPAVVPGIKPVDVAPPAERPPEQPVQTAGAPMTREWFLPHVNSTFDMATANAGNLTIELVQVSAATMLTDRDHHVNYTAFSLLFQRPKHTPEESAVVRLGHPTLGEMELFLSPVGRHKDRVSYEAVFSRRV